MYQGRFPDQVLIVQRFTEAIHLDIIEDEIHEGKRKVFPTETYIPSIRSSPIALTA